MENRLNSHYSLNKEYYRKKNKEYKEKNKEWYKKYNREYYSLNKEKFKLDVKKESPEKRKKRLEGAKKYREKNKEYISNWKKEWRKRNALHVKLKAKRYRKENYQMLLEKSKKYRGTPSSMYPVDPKILLEFKNKKKETDKNYFLKNREKIREIGKIYRKKNWKNILVKKNEYSKKKRREDLNFRLKINCRTRLYQALKGTAKSARTMELIGCNIEELWNHLESKFKPFMRKEDYGKLWQVDHIIPCASFDLSDPEQQKKCFHYTNLQPLWTLENMKKGDKINYEENS